jgi:hypothetical protein
VCQEHEKVDKWVDIFKYLDSVCLNCEKYFC